MKKRLLVILAMLGMPTVALAQSPGPLDQCKDLDTTAAPAIAGLALTSSRAFTYTQVNDTAPRGYYKTMEVWYTLVDADSSITRLDLTCTGSRDNNTTDGVPQDCTSVASGVATCVSGGVWRTATPASSTRHLTIDISKVPDVECTFAVGTGSATAVDDIITVWRRVCVQ